MDRPQGHRSLPSLTALRAFEATARHSSFTRAGEELSISQTAVSHHVRTLEAELEVRLFVRNARFVELTKEGRAWAEALSDVFGRLYAANRRLREKRPAGRRVVTVSVIPSFASRWFVPRLGRFLERHPTIDVRVSTSAELVDFATNDEVDFGIRYGAGRYPAARVEHLYADAWVVVCSPSLRGRARLRTPADLGRFVVLSDDSEGALRAWLDTRAKGQQLPERGVVITDSSMVIDAAVRGQGVALARLSLASDELAARRLVRAFPRIRPLPTGLRYTLVSRLSRREPPEHAAFRAFIHEEIAELRAGA